MFILLYLPAPSIPKKTISGLVVLLTFRMVQFFNLCFITGTANSMEKELLKISDQVVRGESDTDNEESQLLGKGCRKKKKAKTHHGPNENIPDSAKVCW